ncbi:LLM class F420-dependent oxidoreductase [Nocardia stercoris]|uniref:LLM class F420-dependent oxidoreductase n=1 Tax=Nocardia stercoris TaxID=2483361 RepID=A0A3M2L6G8_9NOCA|nr:LLM class F420-dependent oxidoreductase [Nocardia stercoris]RMI33249.1 LLM class F420-dependent oxidoreductase [Nocardia stercoris]
MRFGIFIPQGWRLDLAGIEPGRQWAVMRDLALRADARSVWESLWVYDHFHTVPVPTTEATHEAWTLMSAFAAVTDRIRLGQMCTAVSYRNPALLAKLAATVDVISGGRTELGLGGGWYEHEWRAYGYGFPSAGERLARLDEGVQIVRQAWTTGSATLDGRHYQVDEAIVRPLPLQDNGIPLWVAGGGERKTLRIAAKYAQYTNFGGDAETFARKSEILRAHCAEAGTDFDAITRSSNFNVAIGATAAEVADRIDAHAARLTPFLGADAAKRYVHEQYANSATVGTPEQIAERLRALRALGLEYAITNFAESAYDTSGIELFEREVVPALRD